jgi:hypothetical protein
VYSTHRKHIRVSCEGIIIAYTHDEYCDMLLTPVIIEMALLRGNACYVILVDVIQKLMCFDDWNSSP